MEIKGINEIDLKLRLLSGSSLNVGNLEIEPYTLSEIHEYGYKSYIQNLQWLSITIDDFIDSTVDLKKKEVLEKSKDELRTFDFYMKLGGSEFRDMLLIVLAMLFKTKDIKILNDKLIGIDFEKIGVYVKGENGLDLDQNRLDSLNEKELKLVHRDNFDDIVKVIKYQNYLMKPAIQVVDANPANDEAKELMEHMQRMREKVEQKKNAQKNQEGDVDIDIADIISAVSSKSNSISKLNIWQLTLYQLYDEYSRLELIDNYEFSIKAIMTGAKKVDLKHWSSKI